MNEVFPRAAALLSMMFLAACGERPLLTADVCINSYTGSVTVTENNATQLAESYDITYNTMNRILHILDSRDAKSELSRINGIANSARWPIPSDMFRIIDLINHYSRETDGALDVTLSSVADLWGLHGNAAPEEAPPRDLINASLKGVGQHNVALSDDGTIAFYSPLIRLDLGNLALSYAVDLSAVNMRRRNITNALVRLGPSTRVLGRETPEASWSTTIPDPWVVTQSMGTIFLPAGTSLAHCRIYEETVKIGEKTYGYIVDPFTGRPVEGTAEAVVLGPTATMANSLAQALVVVGLEKAPELLARFPRCEAMIVPNRQPAEIWMTQAISVQFTPVPAYAANLRLLSRLSDKAGAEETPARPVDETSVE